MDAMWDVPAATSLQTTRRKESEPENTQVCGVTSTQSGEAFQRDVKSQQATLVSSPESPNACVDHRGSSTCAVFGHAKLSVQRRPERMITRSQLSV